MRVVVEFCARSKLLLTFVGFGLLLFVQLSSLRSQLDFVLLMFVINLLFVWFVSLQMFVVLLLMFKVVLPVPLLDLFLMLLLLTFPSLCRGPDLRQRVSIKDSTKQTQIWQNHAFSKFIELKKTLHLERRRWSETLFFSKSKSAKKPCCFSSL